MSFDNSRSTFNPRNDYSGVVMQQGRVQLDSDWNEWFAELTRRMQAGTLDLLGRAVYPATTPHAFEITAQGGKLLIGPGRMYVDGLLAARPYLARVASSSTACIDGLLATRAPSSRGWLSSSVMSRSGGVFGRRPAHR